MLLNVSAIHDQNSRYLEHSKQAQENLEMASSCIDTISDFARIEGFSREDDVAILRLGIRVLNDAGAAASCAHSGYYQPALSMIRDIVEVSFLLDLFQRQPERIAEWRTSSEADRKKKFKPVKIRETLDALDGRQENVRKAAYDFFSGHGTHIDPFMQLVSPDSLTMIGPFANEQIVIGFTFDLTRWLLLATGFFLKAIDISHIKDEGLRSSLTQKKINFTVQLASATARLNRAQIAGSD
ncbi:hypothetical protein [Rhizobium sp. AC27/96]|uniref:hypothetical protein n=1 Tax=Rhizobium sp. AC27/96 TaxID=1841653 RepID=UPI0011473190|nr:hypothetical protein [Rhizobium sp. AC27/96]